MNYFNSLISCLVSFELFHCNHTRLVNSLTLKMPLDNRNYIFITSILVFWQKFQFESFCGLFLSIFKFLYFPLPHFIPISVIAEFIGESD